MNFNQFLTEGKEGKNLHLTHIDEDILLRGVEGARDSINFCRSIRDMLAGHTKSAIKITTKFDGAPAIFCGINPENGKFFVATKSVFALNAKLNYTNADVDANHPGEGLNKKLKIALKYLPKLGITGILQGDMMFIKEDLQKKELEPGEFYLTFQPNTIMYAVPYNSELAKRMARAQMGIVFHTSYSGDTIADMKASFHVNINSLRNTEDVWYRDASFVDASGTASFTASETEYITNILSQAGTLFKQMDSRLLNFIASNESYRNVITTFNNTKIRKGVDFGDSRSHVHELQHFALDKVNQTIIDAKKVDTKVKRQQEKNEVLKFYSSNFNGLVNIFEFIRLITMCKNVIIRKLQQVKGTIGTFIPTADGFKITPEEGFVAIDHKGIAVKLVDRLVFSHQNFTITKNWAG